MYEDGGRPSGELTSLENPMNSDDRLDRIYERLLVVQAQGRDHRAFAELVARYEQRLAYYVRRLLGNGSDTVDVLQEIWLLVYRKLDRLTAPEAFRVWLYKLAHDQTVSHLRRRRPSEYAEEPDEAVSDAPEPSDELELMENAELVHRGLEQLSTTHREVLTLKFLEGLELNEIAEIVGCRLGTVKSRLHYAKAALRKILKEQVDG